MAQQPSQTEAQRVKPLMEHEIAKLADQYFKLKDADDTTPERLDEAEGLLEGRVMQWREIMSLI